MSVLTTERVLQNSQIRRYTELAVQKGAVNLAQGLFHVECRPIKRRFVKAYRRALIAGMYKPFYLSYVSYKGLPELRRAIAATAREHHGLTRATEENVVITVGALGAFNCALEALLKPYHHEAILFQPFYSFHRDQLYVKHMGVRAVTLHPPDWSFSRSDLEAAVTPRKTRAIVVNTPSNPSGKVFTRDQLDRVASVCLATDDLYAISDEVYASMAYDGRKHVSLASLPGMWERTITIGSFGKIFGCTGVRIGYAIGPENLIYKMGLSNEYESACAPAPAQWAAADALPTVEWQEQADFFQRKRDILGNALERSGFDFWRPEGAAYILADVSKLITRCGLNSSEDVTLRLMDSPGIATVPAVDFYLDETGARQIRFCFGVMDEDLHEAEKRLATFDVATARL